MIRSSTIMGRKYFLPFIIISFLAIYFTFTSITYYPLNNETTDEGYGNGISSTSKSEFFDEERYMTYLPHSGFHNQRGSLENAIFLSWILNRTLIIPPILFAKKSYIPHRPFSTLYNVLHGNLTNNAISCKLKGLEHRSCKFTLLDWEVLMNFNFINKNIRYIHRNDLDFDVEKLYSFLNITVPEEQVYTLAEEGRYDFQFCDDESITRVSNDQFKYLINLQDLKQRKEKLLHFGSIYSTQRFNLKLKENIKFIKSIEESMIINHPILIDIGEKISEQLGGLGSYVGIHLRLGDNGLDKKFGKKAEENVNNIVNKLLNQFDIPIKISKLDEIDVDMMNSFSPTKSMIESEKCIRSISPEQRHYPIIYVASDKPRNDHRLRRFLKEFPCVFMLNSNFEKYLNPLKQVKNPRDGASLFRYFVPFVDGIVAARGGEFIGTPESTFSDFVVRLHEHWVGS